MPRRRAAPEPAPGLPLEPRDEAILQGQWDAGAFGIAEVRGSRVFYPTLGREFVLRIQDKLLMLGEYRARIDGQQLHWAIPGVPGEQVDWAKIVPVKQVAMEPVLVELDEIRERHLDTSPSLLKRRKVIPEAKRSPLNSKQSPVKVEPGAVKASHVKPEPKPSPARTKRSPVKPETVVKVRRRDPTAVLAPLLEPPSSPTCAVCCTVMCPAAELVQAGGRARRRRSLLGPPAAAVRRVRWPWGALGHLAV